LFIDPNDGGELMLWTNPDIKQKDLRKSEKEISQLEDLPNNVYYVAVYDMRSNVQM
jgi:hypothetical protein